MSGSSHEPAPGTASDWAAVVGVDLDGINADLDPRMATADIAIYLPNNLDPAHHEKVNIELLVDGFTHAKRIFADAGVQLKLSSFTSGYLDPSMFSIDSTEQGSGAPSGRFANMYVEAQRRPSVASTEALEAFESIVGEQPGASRVVHVVVLQDVFMSFYDQLDFRTWQLKTISTGGLSFPGYMYGATMPEHLRGVITITDLSKDSNSWKTIAHEIGHKLLNVSHEYRETSPQHEVRADGGLMLYGSGTEIPSGVEGRFHRERLTVSPYVYRLAGDGAKDWNPGYSGDGFYYDGIYDGISIDLDA